MKTFSQYSGSKLAPDGWPLNYFDSPRDGAVTISDEEHDALIARLQPSYDALQLALNTPKPTSDELLAAKLATGFHDETTGHYLAIEKPDMEMWGMVQSGLNTALLTGAMTAASPFPSAIWGGTAENPNARNVPITGTCGEILGLVFRAMLEFQARHAQAKQETSA